MAEAYLNLGKLYLFERQMDLCKSSLYSSLENANQISARDLLQEIFYSLSQYYKKANNFNKALYFLEKYSNLKDSLHFRNQSDITDMQISYHTEKHKRENELLLKNNSVITLEAEKQRLLKFIFLMGIIILIFIIIGILYLYRHRKRLGITLEKKIQEALLKQREQKQIIVHQAGLTSLGELAASVAHEINQSLLNISLSTDNIGALIQSNSNDNQEIDTNLRDIQDHLHRINYFIEHIRMFSSKQRDDFIEDFSVQAGIENALLMVQNQFIKENIIVKVISKADLPISSGNCYKFEQVILNLLSNAKDAVLLKATENPSGFEKIIVVRNFIEEEKICIEIADNGCGIPPELKTKIFEPFFSTKEFGQGQGLGLSIANEIIKDMGGTIHVSSSSNKGTTVKLCLPLIPDTTDVPGL